MPDIRDDLERLRRMAWACDQSGNTERAAHYRRLIAWIETADEAMRFASSVIGWDEDCCCGMCQAYHRLKDALLPEVER